MRIHKMRKFCLYIDLIAEQVGVLYSFGRSYVCYRSIMNSMSELESDGNPFVVHLSRACAMIGVVEWCHVFGCPERSKLHWHNTAPTNGVSDDGDLVNNEEYKDTVRDVLRSSCNFSKNAFKKYVKTVIGFRNTYAAHRDVGNYREFPFLDKAYKVANAYLLWLKEEISWDLCQTLDELKDQFIKEAAQGVSYLAKQSTLRS